MSEVLLILIAWFMEMPLWLSVVITCFGGFAIVYKIIKLYVKTAIENDLD